MDALIGDVRKAEPYRRADCQRPVQREEKLPVAHGGRRHVDEDRCKCGAYGLHELAERNAARKLGRLHDVGHERRKRRLYYRVADSDEREGDDV